MESQGKNGNHINSQLPPIIPQQSNNNSLYLGKYPPQSVNYYIQIMRLSNLLNIQLFKNVDLISQFLKLPPQQSQKGGKSNNSTQQSNGQKKNDSDQNINQLNLDQQILMSSKQPKRRKRHKETEEQSYQPDVEQYDGSYWVISQSKNMPKSFRKALFNFISKHQKYVDSVLKLLHIPKQQFTQSVSFYSGRINSIADLRGFWSDGQNKYAKAYRIISMQYLRKYSLGYIFNSKINKHRKHIKYRQIIMQGVKHPETFTCMKEF